jgi:hypothetical protein
MKTVEGHYRQALADLRDHQCDDLATFGATCLPAFQAFDRLYHTYPEYHADVEENNRRWSVNAQEIIAFFAKKS